MSEYQNGPGNNFEIEDKPEILDISEQVSAILNSDSPRAVIELYQFLRSPELKKAPALHVTLNYTTLGMAKWAKGFLESKPAGQRRTAAIRATEAQVEEAANVFASGVKWIPVEA